MPSPDPRPLSTPPPESKPAAPIPVAMNLGGAPTPADSQKKRLMVIGGGSLAILALFITVPLVMLATSKKKASPTPTQKATATPKVSIEPSATQDVSSRVFIKDSTARVGYDITLSPPLAWNSSFTTSPAAPAYPWTGSLLVTALKSGYSPLSATNTSASSANYIALMDVTDWLASAQNNVPFTPTQKQAWFAATIGLTADTIASSSGIAHPAGNSSARVDSRFMQPEGSGLRGFVYLTQPTPGRYEPVMITLLVGKLGGRSVAISSQHAIRDKKWAELAALQASGDSSYAVQRDAALANFSAGTLGEDTKAIYAEFIKAIASLKISGT